jgi:hypothetical protein
MLNFYRDGNLLLRDVLKFPHRHGVIKDKGRWTVRIILEFEKT